MSDSVSVSPNTKIKKRHSQIRNRTIARAGAVQALFQYEQSEDSVDQILLQFSRHRGGSELSQFEDGLIPEADMPLLGKIVRKAVLNQEKIDAELSEILPKQWRLDQIDSVLRAILRAALAELEDGLPVAVTINEYMDVTHAFLSVEAARLANGVLETASKRRKQPDA